MGENFGFFNFKEVLSSGYDIDVVIVDIRMVLVFKRYFGVVVEGKGIRLWSELGFYGKRGGGRGWKRGRVRKEGLVVRKRCGWCVGLRTVCLVF